MRRFWQTFGGILSKTSQMSYAYVYVVHMESVIQTTVFLINSLLLVMQHLDMRICHHDNQWCNYKVMVYFLCHQIVIGFWWGGFELIYVLACLISKNALLRCILCLTSRTTMTSECIPEEDVFFYCASNPIPVSHAFKKESQVWCIKDASCSICGVIKQNQSEVGHIQFSVSYWIVTSICKVTFCRKPHWNWTTSSKDISN